MDKVFDFRSGGMSCRSCNHYIPLNRDKENLYFTNDNGGYTGQQLELECQRILRDNGYMSVLEDDHLLGENGLEMTSLDMLINGSRADVRSITTNGPHTIRNGVKTKNFQLLKYNRQNHTHHDTLILHFHDLSLWDTDKITEALREVPTLVNHYVLRRVLCTLNLTNAFPEALSYIEELRSPWFQLMKAKLQYLLGLKLPLDMKSLLLFESHISKTGDSAVVVIYYCCRYLLEQGQKEVEGMDKS